MGVKVKEWKGAWWVFAAQRYRRKAKRVGTGPAGYKAAVDAAKAWDVLLALGQFQWEEGRARQVLFQDYARTWLKTYVAGLKPATQEKYEEVLRVHWLPTLGRLPVHDITRAHIKRVLVEKQGAYSRSMLQLMIAVVQGCLNAAVEDQILATNPVARLGKVLSMPRKRGSVEVFTPMTLASLLETARV